MRLAAGQAEVEPSRRAQRDRDACRIGPALRLGPSFTVSRAVLDSVDLGTLMGQPALAGPFNLSATARGRLGPGRSGGDGPGRDHPLDHGPGGGERRHARRLARGRAPHLRCLTPQHGRHPVAGRGRNPMAAEPRYEVRQGAADALDLGKWLGRPDLATSVNTRFTAEFVPGGPDSIRGPSRARPPSFHREPGEARPRTRRPQRRARHPRRHGSGEWGGCGGSGPLAGTLGDRSRVRTDGTVRVEHLAAGPATGGRTAGSKAGSGSRR